MAFSSFFSLWLLSTNNSLHLKKENGVICGKEDANATNNLFCRQLKLKGTTFNRLLGIFAPVSSQRSIQIPTLFHTRKLSHRNYR